MIENTLTNNRNIAELVQLAEGRSIVEREFLFKKIGTFLTDESNHYSDTEKQIMTDILCRIIGDVEMHIRTELAETLAPLKHIPRQLMIFLANCEIEVASPILKKSKMLSDPDLESIIFKKTQQHQLAIAVRDTISEAISKALIDTGNDDVKVALLKNSGADIPEDFLILLANESELKPAFQEPLLYRPQLPAHIAQKMYAWVSGALRVHVAENFNIDKSALEFDASVEQSTLKFMRAENSPSHALVEKLYGAGELTTGFMLKSLRQSDIELFELSFSRLSGLGRDMISHILYSDNKELLAVACKLIKLDRIVFSTVYALLNSANQISEAAPSHSKSQILDFYDDLTPSKAASLIRNQDFLNATSQKSGLNRLH